MSNVFIPYELVVNVLSRLPVKPLMRFKCVSKLWCGIIDNPDFIKTHVKKSKSSMKVIVQAGTTASGWRKLYELDFSLGEISNMKKIKYPGIIDRYESTQITYTGSCDGLVCLVCSNSSIVLWNPSTQEHLGLPHFSMSKRNFDYCVHGFGYDESTDDYKVVRLDNYYSAHVDTYFYRIHVYSLKSKDWRSLKKFEYGVNLVEDGCFEGVFSNGAVYWQLEDDSILSFNLGTESFQVLLPPPKSINQNPTLMDVAILNGFQHLIFDDINTGEKWIMIDYGSKDPWTKLTLNLSPATQFLIVMPVLVDHIRIYNLENQSVKIVDFSVEGNYGRPSCLYFESLVPLRK